MDNSFRSIIEKAKSILVLLPTKPYFDQVAAGLSLYLALRNQKDISIYCPSDMTVEFNRLIGVNKVTRELGNKNLIIRFADYKANDIERVSYDIEDGQFRLTVIPKQKISPPAQDQVNISYSGISADTVIVVGGANETHFPAISNKELVSANLVHVGTREITLSSNKSYLSFTRPASSVSEIVYGLLADSGVKVDQDVATNLLMGVEDGSSNFSAPGTTAETFATTADLMALGGRRISDQGAQDRNYPPGSIPGEDLSAKTMQTPAQPAAANPPVQQLPPIQIPEPQDKVNYATKQPDQQNENKDEAPKDGQSDNEVPKDWLEPRIYKGTSVS